MKRFYKRYSGGGEGPNDSNLEASIYDDGALVIRPFYGDGFAPFIAERHVMSFIDALRRAYADRYDILTATARRGAAHRGNHERYTDSHRKPKD